MLGTPRGRLAVRPSHRRHDPRAESQYPARARSRDDDLATVHPARPPAPSPCGQRQPLRAHPRRRDRPRWSAAPPGPSTDPQALLLGAAPGRPPSHRVDHPRRQPGTAWQPGLGIAAQNGATLTYDLKAPQTLSQLNLQVIADGRHSVPTTMTITSGTQVRQITLPPIADSTVPGATTTVPVSFPASPARTSWSPSTRCAPSTAGNYYSSGALALPLGIAEIGFPGVTSAPTPAALPGNCVGNLSHH